ncbi:Y-family DNA polymerase, partial [Escherichia coli]|uniref:Y-family DNA polymerase n=1 Tax=Escherichia coli TaxID=562 RepID=UPI003F880336
SSAHCIRKTSVFLVLSLTLFIDLRGVNRCISPEVFGHQLREQVKSWTGLAMGVGIAPTKTLAKSAQWATKQWPQFSGVVA